MTANVWLASLELALAVTGRDEASAALHVRSEMPGAMGSGK